MGVGAAEPEGGHPDQVALVLGQRPGLGHRAEPQRVEVDPRAQRQRVQGGRNAPVPQHQDRLHQPGDPRRGLQVPEVGLDRSHQQRLGTPTAQDRAEGIALHRVPRLGAGAVRLDVGQTVGVDPGRGVDPFEQLDLGLDAGHGEPLGPAVVVHRAGRHDGVHPVAVCQGGVQALQDEHPAALRPGESVRQLGEGVAVTGGREHRRLGEADEVGGAHEDVRPTGQRQRASARADGLPGQVQRGQRRGARRVDRGRRAAHVQEVGDPVGVVARGSAAHVVRAPGVQSASLEVVVVACGDARQHRRVRTGQVCRVDPRVLQCLDGALQQQPLLGVQMCGLLRGDSEEVRVELLDSLQEPTRQGVAPTRPVRADREEVLGREPLLGHSGHRIASCLQQVPQSVRRVRTAR